MLPGKPVDMNNSVKSLSLIFVHFKCVPILLLPQVWILYTDSKKYFLNAIKFPCLLYSAEPDETTLFTELLPAYCFAFYIFESTFNLCIEKIFVRS